MMVERMTQERLESSNFTFGWMAPKLRPIPSKTNLSTSLVAWVPEAGSQNFVGEEVSRERYEPNRDTMGSLPNTTK